tara:strand:+ start:1686 stop:1979 length:294 start_codon:yes stop_codon:yes gene_type:complete
MKNNKLIGDFMDIQSTGLSIYKESAYHYHDSWDWLMPVVEKIECTHDDKGDCFNVMMEAFECTISGLGLTLCLNGHTKMDATYKAVVEFIKEHNDER